MVQADRTHLLTEIDHLHLCIDELQSDLKHEQTNRDLMVASQIADTQDALTITECRNITLNTKLQKVQELIEAYGGIDGGHHKQWLLTEIVKIIVPDFEQWKTDMMNGEDGPHTYYEWDEGIAP